LSDVERKGRNKNSRGTLLRTSNRITALVVGNLETQNGPKRMPIAADTGVSRLTIQEIGIYQFLGKDKKLELPQLSPIQNHELYHICSRLRRKARRWKGGW